MIERRCGSDRTSPARARMPRGADMVFWGTSSWWAISPAGNPSGSWRTRRRKVSRRVDCASAPSPEMRSEEHTSELQSLMRISYAVFCLKKKKNSQTVIDSIIHNLYNFRQKQSRDVIKTLITHDNLL